MNDVTLLAIDLAKDVFQLHGVNDSGKAILKKRLRRNKLVEFVAKLSSCTIAMEHAEEQIIGLENFRLLIIA